MVALVVAALIGGLGTFSLLLPYGMLVAFIGAPFGGASLVLLVGVVLAFRRALPEKKVKCGSEAPLPKRKASV